MGEEEWAVFLERFERLLPEALEARKKRGMQSGRDLLPAASEVGGRRKDDDPPHRPSKRKVSTLSMLLSSSVQFAEEIGSLDAGSSKPQWKAAIDFKWIRDNQDLVAANIRDRNSDANLELVLELYEKFSILQKEVERLRGERNLVAKKMKGKLESSTRQALVDEGKNLKECLAALEQDLIMLTDRLQAEAQCIPNITHPDVPKGGEENSVVRNTVGSPREFKFNVKDHLELGKELDLIDFDSAAEVSGAKFYYLKNEAVLLEMALINWTISEVFKRGFTPLITPEIVRSSVVEKCGFQPRGDNTQVYSIEGSDQCLIGTAEIPVGGFHMDVILSESALPLKYVAYSHCFRTEAGAAGVATRQIHHFNVTGDSIECISSVRLKCSYFVDQRIATCIMKNLLELKKASLLPLVSILSENDPGTPVTTLDMATGDLGAPAYRKFDVEAWMPGLGRYGEISSASNCTDYQSRRLGIRYRPSTAELTSTVKKGKGGASSPTQFVHTLNATACAVPRMIICLLENFQQMDGSIVIPEPLRPFMGGLSVIAPKLKRT
ncbi:Serine--tRNA ligase [Apostasia shenzhenica]|uniref:serine--tRNA ligase n=1 Tax=Apostasia shenzhenica TaxID=1088818 RepID=A0A2I0B1U9_9ASPA|nr:Serine--tRNA ligase [Apostasia shenzhenica]